MSAMPTGFSCTKGFVTQKMVSYYARRAKGGASLIVVEGAAVEERGKVYLSQLMVSDDTYLSGLNNLAGGYQQKWCVCRIAASAWWEICNGSKIQCPLQMFLLHAHVPGKDIVPTPMTKDDINAQLLCPLQMQRFWQRRQVLI